MLLAKQLENNLSIEEVEDDECQEDKAGDQQDKAGPKPVKRVAGGCERKSLAEKDQLVKKSPTGYVLFCNSKRSIVLHNLQTNDFIQVQKKLSELWKELSDGQRYHWHREAQKQKEIRQQHIKKLEEDALFSETAWQRATALQNYGNAKIDSRKRRRELKGRQGAKRFGAYCALGKSPTAELFKAREGKSRQSQKRRRYSYEEPRETGTLAFKASVRKISSMTVSSRNKEYRKSYETNLRNQGKSIPEAPSASNEFQTASKDIPSSLGNMSAKGFSLAGG